MPVQGLATPIGTRTPCQSTVKVNHLQAWRFAEAIGQRAKTDAVDAAMLARFGALDTLQTRPVISQTLSDMNELLFARRGLVKDKVAATRMQA